MTLKKIELTIIKNLLNDEDYLRKVLPFIKDEYFFDRAEKIVFNSICEFVDKYNKAPNVEALSINIQNKRGLSDSDFENIQNIFGDVKTADDKPVNAEWLIDETEKFCQDKAIYNAISDSINILDGKDKQRSPGTIPTILSDALAVTFDNSVGHDYFGDVESRYDYYHRKEKKIPFDIELFNKITKGGLPPKTLNIILAGTGVGKSLAMCHFASSYILQGKNVLYITLEMSEEKIAQRIDANLLNVDIGDITNLSKDMYIQKAQRLKDRTPGKLVIKEYPTAAASATHFKNLLNELRLKKSFVPDVIIVDYLNICASSRIKMGGSVNSYTYVKSIAEELRGLAIEANVPLISATQTTRSGFSNSDVGLDDTSESFGLPATADLMFALITSEELAASNQIMVKQLKNRYSDLELYKRFVIGVDKAKMRLYDAEDSAQSDIMDSGQIPRVNNNPTSKSNKFATLIT